MRIHYTNDDPELNSLLVTFSPNINLIKARAEKEQYALLLDQEQLSQLVNRLNIFSLFLKFIRL